TCPGVLLALPEPKSQRAGGGLVDREAVTACVGDVALRVGLDSYRWVVLREQVPEPLADVPVQVVLALLGLGEAEHRLDEGPDRHVGRRWDLGAGKGVLSPRVVQLPRR